MRLERTVLFSGRDIYSFFVLCLLLLSMMLTIEYRDYKRLTTFDDAYLQAEVVQQYQKQKGESYYQVLRLRSSDGVQFYTTAPYYLRDLQGYSLELLLKTDGLTFLEYMKGFFAYSKISKVFSYRSVRQSVADLIASKHDNSHIAQIFGALFTASAMDRELRSSLSSLGISHLLAISGFHLGVLTFIIIVVLSPLYTQFQQRFFPYRQSRRDLFVMTLLILFVYLWFLDFVPSLVRAFGMMFIGFILYDRGVRVLSMQSLSVTVMLLLSLWPRLFFSLGFWLSVGGVFSILLFLRYFSHWHKGIQFITVHIWVYLMMLPSGLWLFGSFSMLHPLSVLWTMSFIIFYPFVLIAHLIGLGALLDGVLLELLEMSSPSSVTIYGPLVLFQLSLALSVVWYRKALPLLLVVILTVFISAVYQIT